MDEPMIFALTPRAGRWHHRFLIPTGAAWPQEKLGRLADQASKSSEGSDYVSFQRSVTQSTTGRTGVELVLIQDSRLRGVDSETRRRIAQTLETYSAALDALVTMEIDWEAVGVELVVQRPELRQWQLAAAVLLDRPRQRPGRNPDIFAVRVLAIVLAAVLLAVVVVLAWQHLLRPQSGVADKHVTSESSKSQSAIDPANVTKLAKTLGLGSLPQGQQLEQIREKLEGLFERPGGDDQEGDDERVGLALKCLYSWHFGKESEDTNELIKDWAMTGDEGILKKLFPNGEFDSCGLLDKKMELKKVSAEQFRKLCVCLVGIKDIERDKLPQDGFYADFFREVHTSEPVKLDDPPKKFEGWSRQFYLPSDSGWVPILQKLLQSESVSKLCRQVSTGPSHSAKPRSPLEPGAGSSDAAKMAPFQPESDTNLLGSNVDSQQNSLFDMLSALGAKFDPGNDSLISSTSLDQQKKNVSNDADKSRAFELLKTFVEACKLAAPPETDKHPSRPEAAEQPASERNNDSP